MLNRRRKIHKYVTALQGKRRQQKLRNHHVLAYKLDDQDIKSQEQHNEEEGQQQQLMAEGQLQQERACWEDPDDNFNDRLDINSRRNKFKKLNLQEDGDEQQYEGKLRKFYQKNYAMNNWADDQNAEGQEERDLNDYLDEEILQKRQNPTLAVQFHSRSHQKHDSIVTGLEWHKNVLFSAGLDHKIKIWSISPQESNPELKMTLQKDIYLEGLPISSCYFTGKQLFCGTLRKNVAIIDSQKWRIRYSTSSFMSRHKNYQNLKINRDTFTAKNENSDVSFSIHSDNCVTLLDKNFSYIGNLFANEEIADVTFAGDNILAVTDTSFYAWNLKTMRISEMAKTHLGFTKIAVKNDTLAIGSRLGNVYLYDLAKSQKGNKFEPYAEVQNMLTHTTSLNENCKSSHNSLILSLSKWKANAARIIDTSKGQCIGNWPSIKTKISFPTIGAFSESDMMAIGSTNGFITTFKLQ